MSEKEEVLHAECSLTFYCLKHIHFTCLYKEQISSMSKRKQFRTMDELVEQEILAEQDPVQVALDHFFAEEIGRAHV